MRETRCKIQKCLLLWKLAAGTLENTVCGGGAFRETTKSCEKQKNAVQRYLGKKNRIM